MFLMSRFPILVFFIVVCALSCSTEQTELRGAVEHGKYLVNLGGCHDCHTPKIFDASGAPTLDTARLLSGHAENRPAPSWSPEDLREGVAVTSSESFTAWAGPWGVSFAANLTPEKTTGIAEWNEEMFIRMARTGKPSGTAKRSGHSPADAMVQHEASDR